VAADNGTMGVHTLSDWWSRRRMRRRAGQRARDRYKAQRRAWLRENRKLFAVLNVVAAAIVAAFHLAMAWWPGDQVWVCGLMTGVAAATVLILRRTPPTAVEKWQEGAWGEEMTASELSVLARKGWVVLNDLRNGGYNFDHVVLGPAGAFCLNSKKSSSRLEVSPDGKTLFLQNRYDDDLTWTDRKMLGQVRRDAATLSRVIQQRTGQRVWVHPVLVWWGPYPKQSQSADGVGVVHGSRLVERLEAQPPRRIHDLAAVAAALEPGRRRAPRPSSAQSATAASAASRL
jgi:hypothetical protein